jgi:acyl transferase domain-containing protein
MTPSDQARVRQFVAVIAGALSALALIMCAGRYRRRLREIRNLTAVADEQRTLIAGYEATIDELRQRVAATSYDWHDIPLRSSATPLVEDRPAHRRRRDD